MLFRAAQLLVERKEQFARDMTRQMGKVLDETRQCAGSQRYDVLSAGLSDVRSERVELALDGGLTALPWMFFSGWKSICVDFSGKLQRAQIDNNWR